MAKSTALLLALSLSILATAANAQQLQTHSEGNITYLSGGIGQEERTTIMAIEGSYNLHLLFTARDTGEYLWGVKVRLTDPSGKSLLDTVSDGPYFLARLPPGKYTVLVDYSGKPLSQAVDIPRGASVSHSFSWPSAD
ncbi:MAG: carboxypeptidase-like regulatory domain-containing protein [Alphaproteobacteria bacterium]